LQRFFSCRLKEKKQQNMQVRKICRFPNPVAYSIDDSKFKEKFGDRYCLLCETPEYAAAQAFTDYKDVPDDMRQYFPQDHPFWLQFRSAAQLTGSVTAALLGMHDAKAAKILSLPKCMYVMGGNNEKWDDYIDRLRYPGLPSTGLDPPGNVHAAGGVFKESGALGTLLAYVPNMVAREVGAIVITPAHLQAFTLHNLVSGERLIDLPFKLVVSPDADATIPRVLSDDVEDYSKVEMIDVAGEIKAPTYFQMQEKSRFVGLEFWPKGYRCQPYDHPKEYYLPQTFLEMLALGRRACLFFSYTLGQGAVGWLIHMQEEYLSAILTVLIILHERFARHCKPVPTDYFFTLDAKNPERVLYERMLQMTNDIAGSAPEYIRLSEKQTNAFGKEMGFVSDATNVDFPVLPHGNVFFAYQRILIYAYRLYRDWDRFTWVCKWEQINDRINNIVAAISTPLTAFVGTAIMGVIAGDVVTAKYPAATHSHRKVRARVCEVAESYVADVLHVVHMLYGAPPFGEALSPDVFVNNAEYAATKPHTGGIVDGIGCDDAFWDSQPATPMTRYARVIHDIVADRRRTKKTK